MTHTFALDSQLSWGELSNLGVPGFYWINIDRKIDAEHMCRHIIRALNADSKAAVICNSEDPKIFLGELGPISVKKVPLFSMVEKKEILFQLTTDFKRSVNSTNCLFILMTHSTLWESLNKEEFNTWIQKTSNWFNKEQSTFLILNYGTGSKSLNEQLVKQHRYLDGLTHLQWLVESWQYFVTWWGTDKILTANQTLNLIEHDSIWIIESSESNQDQLFKYLDEGTVYAEKNVLEGAIPQSSNWHMIENNQLLAETSMNLKSSTIIFAFYNDSQIEELAKQIYALRRNCGNHLKIIIREMSSSLRFSSQRILMSAGANLIVPYVVTLSKFFTMLESTKGQIFYRTTPEHFDDWLKVMRPIPQKGYLPSVKFLSLVKERMDNTLLPENSKGVLVSMLPSSKINAAQALSLCNLHRMGDLVTIIEGHLILFLSDCTINDLEITFTYIFRMPVDEIFTNYQSWDHDLLILAEIKKFRVSDEIIKPDNNLEGIIENKQIETTTLPVVRRQPVDLTLTIDSKEG